MSSGPDTADDVAVVSAAGLRAEIVVGDGDWSVLEPQSTAIAAALGALTAEVPAIAGEVAILLAGDAKVRGLNRQFRGIDKATNVLSFPRAVELHAPANGEPRVLGDIVLAAETLLREAGELGILPVHHFQHLVMHGVLHLAGFDHGDDADAHVMEKIEIRALARLGIANPYEDLAVAGTVGSEL